MEEQKKFRLNSKIVIGLIILIFGILLLLENLDYDLKFDPLDYWPLILIVIGLSQLLQPRESRRYFGGFVLLIIGGLFLANNLVESFHFEIGQLWPLVIVFIGFRILTHGFWRSKKEPIGEDHINIAAILGGGEYNFSNKKLKGGKLTAIMGGCTVDLRDADFVEDVIMIDTFAFWGGIEIRVPQAWQVVMEGTPILGGMENKTRFSSNNNGAATEAKRKRLVIKGLVIMGGVEISN